MILILLLSVLMVCSAQAAVLHNSEKVAACPDSVLISPCVCILDGQNVNMTCTGLSSLQALSDIFARTFPTNELHSIVITGSRLDVMPSDVFKGKSFQVVSFLDNPMASFPNPGVFSSSAARLTSLTIDQDTETWAFNLANVQGYNALTFLRLTGYNMMPSGTLSSTVLNTLILRSDLINSVSALGSLPALSILSLDGSAIVNVPANSFSTLSSLTQLYLGHNKIVTLGTGALVVSNRMTVVDLSSNLISGVNPGWITGKQCIRCKSQFTQPNDGTISLQSGLTPSVSLQLVNNYIRQLNRTSFEEPIKALQPSGTMLLDGNPLGCGCDVAWAVTDPAVMAVISDARCANGTRLTSLNPDYFLQNC